MNKRALYRRLVRLVPGGPRELTPLIKSLPDNARAACRDILRSHRAQAGALALFDRDGLRDHFVYGQARKGLPVGAETAFRLASVSKLVTSAGILAMRQQGLVDLDADADAGLPYSLRHPEAPDRPVSLRMLLSHTAGIRDGGAYTRSLSGSAGAGELLQADSHTSHLPMEGCEYSNFGFGLAGCVVEAQTGLSFQAAMARCLFEPLGLRAAYYPQLLTAQVADARRVLPPRRRPNYDGAARQAAPLAGWQTPDLMRHHLLAHGNCCTDVGSLAALGRALLTPGLFTGHTLELMRSPHASLGSRDPYLRQGLGMFILRDERIGPMTLYGHQGMAYGAVHMLFLDPDAGRGIISLTVGASEAREYILADLNRDLLRWWTAYA